MAVETETATSNKTYISKQYSFFKNFFVGPRLIFQSHWLFLFRTVCPSSWVSNSEWNSRLHSFLFAYSDPEGSLWKCLVVLLQASFFTIILLWLRPRLHQCLPIRLTATGTWAKKAQLPCHTRLYSIHLYWWKMQVSQQTWETKMWHWCDNKLWQK